MSVWVAVLAGICKICYWAAGLLLGNFPAKPWLPLVSATARTGKWLAQAELQPPLVHG